MIHTVMCYSAAEPKAPVFDNINQRFMLDAATAENSRRETFGYLYPASILFFWEREEEQVRSERFDALFMNLWDVRRTLGLESLLFNHM